jgi:DNA-binding NarL/FixJ family response regulator
MDLRLPDGTGVDACREILAANPATRVLFLTSHSDEEACLSTILAGAAGYLLKEAARRCSSAPYSWSMAAVDTRSGSDQAGPQSHVGVAGKAATTKASAKDALSPQEQRILALVVEGRTNKEIAKALGLSDKTVKNY